MKKRVWILTAALCFALCMMAMYQERQSVVWAKEQPAEQQEKEPAARSICSKGNFVYRDGGEKVGIYEADFFLLYEKLSAIPKEAFDPACYTHYDRTDQTEKYQVNICIDSEYQSTETLEADKAAEMSGEDAEVSVADEVSEINREKTEESVADETSEINGEEQLPEMSVSGNDCMKEQTENGAEEMTDETDTKGGEM